VLAGLARVVARDERADRTAAFAAGARACLAQAPDAAWALLKEGSPSCGVNLTWIDGEKVPGKGVFAALVAAVGIPARSEEDLG
ncbi:MAG: 2-thiouracil desulfurase family protein, partial [Pseudomonadota bacterium]